MSKHIHEQYSELLHYTTAAGLNGILRNGSLWATHSSFLNDAEEITHYFDFSFLQIISEVRREKYVSLQYPSDVEVICSEIPYIGR